MAHSRSTLGILTIVIVLGGLAAAIYWRLRPEPAEEANATEPGEHAEVVESVREQFNTEVAVPVSGVPAVLDTLWISVTAEGRAVAIREVKLVARVSGIISSAPVRENQSVSANQLLVQVDTTEYALNVASMDAARRKAEADYQALVLFDDELEDEDLRARRDQRARAATGLDQAEVDYRRSLITLANATVRAPFGGRVADLKVVVGQFVSEGTELLTIVDLDPIKVEVQVLGTEVVYLNEGRAAEIEFTAFPGQTFSGRIETINPIVDAEGRTSRVTIHIPNSDGLIRPGMYAEASLEAQEFPDRILVPRVAVLERGERRRSMLFVLTDGKAKWRYVDTGHENDAFIEIVEGEEWVAPGEIVLTNGHQYLTHDALVRLVDDPVAEGGRPVR